MSKIIIINGPNLNLLGEREQTQYGSTNYSYLEEICKNRAKDLNIDMEALGIKEAFVNGGPVMKRFRAASMGRASRLRRPTSHLTIIITNEK